MLIKIPMDHISLHDLPLHRRRIDQFSKPERKVNAVKIARSISSSEVSTMLKSNRKGLN